MGDDRGTGRSDAERRRLALAQVIAENERDWIEAEAVPPNARG